MKKKLYISVAFLFATFVGLGFVIGLDNTSLETKQIVTQNTLENNPKRYLCQTLSFDKVNLTPYGKEYIEDVNKERYYGVNPTSINSTVGCFNVRNLGKINSGSSHEKARTSILIADINGVSMNDRVEAIRIFNCSNLAGSFCDIKTESGKRYQEIGDAIYEKITKEPNSLRPFECSNNQCTVGSEKVSQNIVDLTIIGMNSFVHDLNLIRSNYIIKTEKPVINSENKTVTIDVSILNKAQSVLNFTDFQAVVFKVDNKSVQTKSLSSSELEKKYQITFTNNSLDANELCNDLKLSAAITTDKPSQFIEIRSISSNSQQLYRDMSTTEISKMTITDQLEVRINKTKDCKVSQETNYDLSNIVAMVDLKPMFSYNTPKIAQITESMVAAESWTYQYNVVCYPSGPGKIYHGKIRKYSSCSFSTSSEAYNHCDNNQGANVGSLQISDCPLSMDVSHADVNCNPILCTPAPKPPTPKPPTPPTPTPPTPTPKPGDSCFNGSDSLKVRFEKGIISKEAYAVACCNPGSMSANAVRTAMGKDKDGNEIYLDICTSCFVGEYSAKSEYEKNKNSSVARENYKKCCSEDNAKSNMNTKDYNDLCEEEILKDKCEDITKKANCLEESDKGFITEAGGKGINSDNYKCLLPRGLSSESKYEIPETTTNPYCKIYCKEDVEYFFPGIGYNPHTGYNIGAGQYFTFKDYYDTTTKTRYDTFPHLTQTRTCLHEANFEKLEYDLEHKEGGLIVELYGFIKEYYTTKIEMERIQKEVNWIVDADCDGVNPLCKDLEGLKYPGVPPLVKSNDLLIDKVATKTTSIPVGIKTINDFASNFIAFDVRTSFPYFGNPGNNVKDRQSECCKNYSPWEAYSNVTSFNNGGISHIIGDEDPVKTKNGQYYTYVTLSKGGRAITTYYRRHCLDTNVDANARTINPGGISKTIGNTRQYSGWNGNQNTSFSGTNSALCSDINKGVYANVTLGLSDVVSSNIGIDEYTFKVNRYFKINNNTSSSKPKVPPINNNPYQQVPGVGGNTSPQTFPTGNRACLIVDTYTRTCEGSTPPDLECCKVKTDLINKTKGRITEIEDRLKVIEVKISGHITKIKAAINSFNRCSSYNNNYSSSDEPTARNFTYDEKNLQNKPWTEQIKDIGLQVSPESKGQTLSSLTPCNVTGNSLNCDENLKPKKASFTYFMFKEEGTNIFINDLTYESFINQFRYTEEIEYHDYAQSSATYDKKYSIGHESFAVKQRGEVISRKHPAFSLYLTKQTMNPLGYNSLPISTVTPPDNYTYKFEVVNLGKDNRLLPEFKKVQEITGSAAEYVCLYRVVKDENDKVCFKSEVPANKKSTDYIIREELIANNSKEYTLTNYKEDCCVRLDANGNNIAPEAMGLETYRKLCLKPTDPGEVCYAVQIDAYEKENDAKVEKILFDELEKGKISENEFKKQCCTPREIAESNAGMGKELYDSLCHGTTEKNTCFVSTPTEPSDFQKYKDKTMSANDFSNACCSAHDAREKMGEVLFYQLCTSKRTGCIEGYCPDEKKTITCYGKICVESNMPKFYARIVEITNINPTKRLLGNNWLDVKGTAAKNKIEADGGEIYLSEVSYSFTLTGQQLMDIKADTKSKTKNGYTYIDLFEMQCDENNERCLSEFVDKYADPNTLDRVREKWLFYSYKENQYLYK